LWIVDEGSICPNEGVLRGEQLSLPHSLIDAWTKAGAFC
jgi:hypothetical protein